MQARLSFAAMITITFIERDGSSRVVEAESGRTLMQAGRDNNITGILADCGGACSCATCHVIVAADWVDKLPPVSEMEAGMLDGAFGREANSRLSCQIPLEDGLNGLAVRVPAEE